MLQCDNTFYTVQGNSGIIRFNTYENSEDYAKVLLEGVCNSIDAQDLDNYLTANGYAAGAEGLAALNKYVEDVLGALGVAVYTDELNAKDEEIQQNTATALLDLRGYDDIPMEEVEAAYQELPQDGSDGVGAEASEDYYIKPSRYTDEAYAEEILKQLYLHNQDGTADAFMMANGFEAGDEGKKALINEAQDRIGAENVVAYWEELNETYGGNELQHGITSPSDASEPPTGPPVWEGRRGEKLYLTTSYQDWSQDFFGDSNSEDTIEYLKFINENTPIAGGISGIIDRFEDDELRMITRTVEITAEDINKQRVAQTESKIKGFAGFAGFIMDIASFYASGKQYTDSAGVTNDSFMNYGMENITGQVDTESICHAIADFLTPKVSGNETYTREVARVYCFTPDTLRGEGYIFTKMEFTFDYTPDAWHYAKVNHEEYYNNY